MISPRLQELITSPEGLMIAGMTAVALAAGWAILGALLRSHERRERKRIAAEIEAAARFKRQPEDAARWTP